MYSSDIIVRNPALISCNSQSRAIIDMTTFPEKITDSVKNLLSEPAIAKQFVIDHQTPQVLKSNVQTIATFTRDAVADTAHQVSRGVIHKYRNRVLLIASSHCAVHCRYCFRQHFDYSQDTFQESDLPELQNYLQAHPDINEVIFSGGDPLMLSTTKLEKMFTEILTIQTIQRIRIHSRIITVLSKRINPELLALLKRFQSQLVLVTHINHANEVDAQATQTISQLKQLGLWLLNQSVLLKGVNDDPTTLQALSEKLFEIGVQPYYLNLLDKVIGAEQFYIADTEAAEIYRQFASMTSGYLLPKLVRDDGESDFKRIAAL